MASAEPPVARFDPQRIIETLLRHRVRFVVIGMMAGKLWGDPHLTQDLDICYARDDRNLEALAAALRELGARLRGVREEVPFILDARTLKMGDSFTFRTAFGDLDCLGTPAGTHGYQELIANASELDFDGPRAWVASIADLIRMKRAAGRPKDLVEIATLEALLEEIERRSRRGTKADEDDDEK